ncbi:MAG: glycosyltransferase, partial [Hyphomicrobiales bacterium]
GWAGKMWALNHGIAHAQKSKPNFYWFTDADIHHEPGVLTSLVNHAQQNKLALVSLMVRLHVKTFWEKLLVPAFIYYFSLLYPFPAINDRKSKIAGAAGGCILIKRGALEGVGGIAAVRDAVIDDCAVGKIIKKAGNPIWLGLGEHSHSLRGYANLSDFWLMVKRSAFTQLHHSLILTCSALAGLSLTFLAPPFLFLLALGEGTALVGVCAFAAWILMIFTYSPTIRYHGLSSVWSLSLPISALLFGAMTLDSALSGAFGGRTTWRGRDINGGKG